MLRLNIREKQFKGGNIYFGLLFQRCQSIMAEWCGRAEQFISWQPGTREGEYRKSPVQVTAQGHTSSDQLFPHGPTSYLTSPPNNPIILVIPSFHLEPSRGLIHLLDQSPHDLIVSEQALRDTSGSVFY
jgi:hypothetical protein